MTESEVDNDNAVEGQSSIDKIDGDHVLLRKHVIVGGLGSLGRCMQQLLLKQDGVTVTVVDRELVEPEGNSKLLPNVEYVPFELGSSSSSSSSSSSGTDMLKKALQDADTVYSMVTPNIRYGTENDFVQTNQVGVQQLLDACHEVGVRKLVYVSTIAMTNHLVDSINANEETPLPPWETYQLTYDVTKRKGEAAVLQASEQGLLRTCAIRAGGILVDPTDYFFSFYPSGAFFYPTGCKKFDWIYAKDVCQALYLASQALEGSDSPLSGKAVFVSKAKNGSMTVGEVCHAAADAFGWRCQCVPQFLYGMVRRSAQVKHYLQEAFWTQSPETKMGMPPHLYMQICLHEKTFDNSLARHLLQFEPQWTIEEAVHDIAVEYGLVERAAEQDNEHEALQPGSFTYKWARVVESIKRPPLKVILQLSKHATLHPCLHVVGIILFSVAILLIGLATNFHINVDNDVLWTPQNSKPIQHHNWITDESGYPADPRWFNMLVHSNGGNVLGRAGVRRLFEAVDTVRETPGYQELCTLAGNRGVTDSNTGELTCYIQSATRFWNNSRRVFEEEVSSDKEAIAMMSSVTFPDGEPVDREYIHGLPVFEEEMLQSAKAYRMTILLPPDEDKAMPFEADALDRVLDLQDAWKSEPNNNFRVDAYASRSPQDESMRTIMADIPLVPFVFVVMSMFCCLVFGKRHKVRSQCILGVGAVVCVFLSITTGYGLMFVIGVPLTSLTQMLPFVMFGIGLDDIFIIAGAYERTDPSVDPSKRAQITMQDVGGTIMMTTLTTATAFALGCISSIPSVVWLCCYAVPTILIGFVYQISFFVALIVFDGRRVQANRYDCLVCYTARFEADEALSIQDQGFPQGQTQFVDRMMGKYANYLLLPKVKALVTVCFAVLFGLCAYSTTLLTQEFDWTSILPQDSYIIPYKEATNGFTNNRDLAVDVYFRCVDFSDSAIRSQMRKYVDDLVELPYISVPPVFFWLDDFENFANEYEIQGLGFEKQMDHFLADPVYSSLYEDNIVRDALTGRVTTTRTKMFFDGVNSHDVLDQIKVLLDQRKVTKAQSINQGLDDWKFFTLGDRYFSWEFYSVAVRELVLSTIVGVAAISGLTVILIPHWSAVLFVAPLLVIMYADLLGVAQFAGLHINAVTYVSMVMSIGLIVDYLMHVALRFFESPGTTRQAKTKSVLQTMGSSIMVGCLSTILGMVPLAFSTSEIFRTVFIIFLGLTTLGMGHGLILLPVILSTVGPCACVPTEKTDLIDESSKTPQNTVTNGMKVNRTMETASMMQSTLSLSCVADEVDVVYGASKDVGVF